MIRARHIAISLFELTEDGHPPERIAERCAAFLSANHLESYLPKIIAALEELEAEKIGKKSVIIRSSGPLSESVRKTIAERISGGETQKSVFIEESKLLGGYDAEYRYRKTDHTLRYKLDRLEKHLTA